MAREYWLVDDAESKVGGPYHSEQDARQAARDYAEELGYPVYIKTD